MKIDPREYGRPGRSTDGGLPASQFRVLLSPAPEEQIYQFLQDDCERRLGVDIRNPGSIFSEPRAGLLFDDF